MLGRARNGAGVLPWDEAGQLHLYARSGVLGESRRVWTLASCVQSAWQHCIPEFHHLRRALDFSRGWTLASWVQSARQHCSPEFRHLRRALEFDLNLALPFLTHSSLKFPLFINGRIVRTCKNAVASQHGESASVEGTIHVDHMLQAATLTTWTSTKLL